MLGTRLSAFSYLPSCFTAAFWVARRQEKQATFPGPDQRNQIVSCWSFRHRNCPNGWKFEVLCYNHDFPEWHGLTWDTVRHRPCDVHLWKERVWAAQDRWPLWITVELIQFNKLKELMTTGFPSFRILKWFCCNKSWAGKSSSYSQHFPRLLKASRK